MQSWAIWAILYVRKILDRMSAYRAKPIVSGKSDPPNFQAIRRGTTTKPAQHCRTGLSARSNASRLARVRPDDADAGLRPRTGGWIGEGPDAGPTEPVATFLRSAPAALSLSATEVRRDGAFSFTALSAKCSVSIRQAHRWVPPAARQPVIERAARSLPELLARRRPEPTDSGG